MLRRLQIKIIAVALGTLMVVFAAVLLVLNLSASQTSVKRSEDFMRAVIENDGFMFTPRSLGERPSPEGAPPGGRQDGPGQDRMGRYFYCKIDENGGIIELNLDMMFDFPADEAQGLVTGALDSGRSSGGIENYSFLVAEKSYGSILVFSERSIELSLLSQLTRTSLWAAGIAAAALAGLSALLAKWMVRPVKNAFEKQRRFISDASHELKTPLTIISANADVLENEIGENQRLAHIKAQSGRMSSLVHDLLALAKTDEGYPLVKNAFDLSAAVLNAVLEFESPAFEAGKQYTYDIAENITFTGDEQQIKQLVHILIDNAVRHSDENGKIDVSLRAENGRARISVYNTGEGVPDEEKGKIFERFYRSDVSRSRETGGYGVGLSIAQGIAHAHRIKINVSGEYHSWVRFDVIL